MASRYTAHLEVRQNLGCVLMITGLGGLGALVNGLARILTWQGWLLLLLAAALLLAFVGVWRAREWARWASGILCTLYVVGCVGNIFLAPREINVLGAVVHGIYALLFATIAWYCVLPSTRIEFSKAREAITRARTSSG